MLARSSSSSGSFVGHIDRLHARLARADRRAGLDAQAAAGAILDIELQGEARFRIAARVDGRRFEARGRAGQRALVIVSRADDAMRADEAALAALDAEVLLPDRDRFGDIALFEGAVPDGKVPSAGIRLTGMSSPRPASIRAVTVRTKSGASSPTSGISRAGSLR